ncbi:Uncharacterised protein [Staphylococcus aureus]|nr:Uncharacterised protein [Staphylococcus aureus]
MRRSPLFYSYTTNKTTPPINLGVRLKINVPKTFLITLIDRCYRLLKLPYLPLFSYPSLNLVKQNVDLTGICYITLSFDLYRRRILTFPKRSQDMLILYITSPKINLTFPSYFPMHRALFLFLFVRFHLINENKHP